VSPSRRLRTRGTASDLLVEVWRLVAQGREEEARARLMRTWWWTMDDFAEEQHGAVALRLFDRLGFCTDDLERWEELPGELVVYRAGSRAGLSWTTELEVTEDLARSQELWPIRTGTVAKAHVLAYITERGEDEVIVRPEHVQRQRILVFGPA
jgi:hypothetical protein